MASILEDQEQFERRNAEDVHKALLADAQAHHTNVREFALNVLKTHNLTEEVERLKQKRLQEEARLKVETAKANEAIRIRLAENEAKQLPKPPPRVPTPPPQASIQQPQPQTATTPQPQQQSIQQRQLHSNAIQQPNFQNTPVLQEKSSTTFQQPSVTTPLSSAPGHTPTPAQSLSLPPIPPQAPPRSAPEGFGPRIPTAATTAFGPPKLGGVSEFDALHAVGVERLLAIHRTGKELRQFIASQDKAFVQKAGEMRRKIVRSVGQLIPVGDNPAVNHRPRDTIIQVLNEALLSVASPPIDPSMFLLTKPVATEQSEEDDQLPSLFLYLFVIFAKAIVSQCVSELSTNTRVAQPLGVLVMVVFSRQQFLWRGTSFISILVSKFRVSCPVLFGVRGSERTQEGRARLAWRKDINGEWISDEEHYNRMSGIAAGYAAVTLRKFPVRMVNPYPPTHYWTAIAQIVTTASDEVSPTQRVVLKALIDNNWTKFVETWGDMAVEALKVALLQFPHRGAWDATAGSLVALAQTVHVGLELKQLKRLEQTAQLLMERGQRA